MSEPSLQAVAGLALVTADLQRLVAFYRDVLGFAPHGTNQPIAPVEMALLGLSGRGMRQILTLGEQTVWIEQFEPAGRAYPDDGNAASLWFQHLALVTDDMPAAYSRLRGATPISEGGPQLLPASSGGVQAFKFRDPDGHPLELLQFAGGETPAAWQNRRKLAGAIGLGIDHSAISVSDADASAAFYQARGLESGKTTLNRGPAQNCLDGLVEVTVAVVPMKPPCGVTHLELLGYRTPRGKAGPAGRPNDVAATRVIWRGGPERLFCDPDGHLHQILA